MSVIIDWLNRMETSAARHVGDVEHYPFSLTVMSKFHIARYQFAELRNKIKISKTDLPIFRHFSLFHISQKYFSCVMDIRGLATETVNQNFWNDDLLW